MHPKKNQWIARMAFQLFCFSIRSLNACSFVFRAFNVKELCSSVPEIVKNITVDINYSSDFLYINTHSPKALIGI